MNSHIKLLLAALTFGAFALAASPLHASGTYRGSSPPPPRAQDSGGDRALYSYGQRIFTNKVPLQAHENREAQSRRLTMLQAQLPKRTAKKRDLVALAGRLTPDQLQALEYYVNQRFGK
ncbi:MAG TPA: hypothetical protein VMN36_03270 [Verrucomicrobiales bacterium]|nr:hypothetical protein [Verrucomicrobiales bacterium]